MAKLVPELIVTDIERSLAFYVGVLGFAVLYERPEEGFAYLDRDGAELMLDRRSATGARDWVAAPLEPPFGRGVNLQVGVADAGALHRRCLAEGAAIFWPLETKWYRRDQVLLGVRQFIVQDPDGYLIRLSELIGAQPAEAREE